MSNRKLIELATEMHNDIIHEWGDNDLLTRELIDAVKEADPTAEIKKSVKSYNEGEECVDAVWPEADLAKEVKPQKKVLQSQAALRRLFFGDGELLVQGNKMEKTKLPLETKTLSTEREAFKKIVDRNKKNEIGDW